MSEYREFSEVSRDFWSQLSPALKKAINLNIALPEKYEPTSSKAKESRREKEGKDSERELELGEVLQSMTPEEHRIYADYQQKKVKYFTDLALSHKQVGKIFEKYGILGKQGKGWKAVSRHSFVVAEICSVYAEALRAKGYDVDPREIQIASILHDVTKKREILEKKAIQSQGGENVIMRVIDLEKRLKQEMFEDEEIKNAILQYLPSMNDPEKYKSFCELVGSAGAPGLTKLVQEDGLDLENFPFENMSFSRVLGNRLLFYADKMVKHTGVVGFKERMEEVMKRYSLPGVPYVEGEYETVVTNRIEKDLANKLGINPDDMVEFFISKFYNKLMRKYSNA